MDLSPHAVQTHLDNFQRFLKEGPDDIVTQVCILIEEGADMFEDEMDIDDTETNGADFVGSVLRSFTTLEQTYDN